MERLNIFIALGFALMILPFNTFSQTRQTGKNNPRIEVKVQRHYDNNGNVIGYDSTYTYLWSDTRDNQPLEWKGNGVNFKFSPEMLEDSTLNRKFFSQSFPMDSMMMGFFGGDLDSQSFPEFEFTDSTFFGENLERQFKEIMEQQQSIMEQFMNGLHLRNEPIIPAPDQDSTTVSQKQNNTHYSQKIQGTKAI